MVGAGRGGSSMPTRGEQVLPTALRSGQRLLGPLQGAVDGGASDAEQLGKVRRGPAAVPEQLDAVRLLAS